VASGDPPNSLDPIGDPAVMVLDRLLAPAQTIGAAPELPASIRADLEAAVGGERREVAWAGSHGE
jgi:hypothetical protein